MKCTKCGTWSTVLNTRETYDGLVTRRERKCANDHRFTSYEVHATMWTHVKKRMLVSAETIKRRWALWSRNDKIRRELASGVPGKELAVKWGVSKSLISLINRNKL